MKRLSSNGAMECGGCLVGLAAMLTEAKASEATAENSSESNDIFMKVAAVLLLMWTVLVVIVTLQLSGKAQQRALTLTTGSQTEDNWKPTIEHMTVQSMRHELARRRLPQDGSKPELAARLSLAMAQAAV
jgi:hypothetical protein